MPKKLIYIDLDLLRASAEVLGKAPRCRPAGGRRVGQSSAAIGAVQQKLVLPLRGY